MSTTWFKTTLAAAVVGALWMGGSAGAEPVLKAGGKPGVAVSWTANGDVITLTIGEGFSAEDVASAIIEQVPGVSAKAEKNAIVLTGKPKDELVKALASVDIASADDVDSMVAAMQSPGGDDDSGSSIRATQAADFSEIMGDKAELVSARVVEVKRAKYPMVLLTVQVSKVPKGFKEFKAGAKIAVLPRVKTKGTSLDTDDPVSKLNTGAWYAQAGDKILLRLGEKKDGFWVAEAFSRVK